MIVARIVKPDNFVPAIVPGGDVQRLISAMMAGMPDSEGRAFSRRPAFHTPPMDLTETADAYVVRLEVPGFAKESLEIDINGGNLRVTGKRGEGEDEKPGKEFLRASFTRSVTLPGELEEEGHRAELKDGILTVTLKKAAPRSKGFVKIAIE